MVESVVLGRSTHSSSPRSVVPNGSVSVDLVCASAELANMDTLNKAKHESSLRIIFAFFDKRVQNDRVDRLIGFDVSMLGNEKKAADQEL
jgi:hypothetical protein